MATLVSPGVSVTVTDESFFIPAAAPTVPLIFIATGDEKKQQDGVTDAAGTFESGVVRTVTSQRQLLELYGTPVFREDSAGNQYHGDARNEYGLFAAWQFLAQGSRCYVVRANVNLDDDIDNIRNLWDRKITDAAFILENRAVQFIAETNASRGKFVGDPWQNAYWTVDFGGNLTNDTPLPLEPNAGSPAFGSPPGSPALAGSPNEYGFTLTVDGVSMDISIPSSFFSIGKTVADLVDEINTQITTQAAAGSPDTEDVNAYAFYPVSAGSPTQGGLDGNPSPGDIVIVSTSTNDGGTALGPSSSITISSDTLFPVLNYYAGAGSQTAGVYGYKETLTQAEYESLVNTVMTDEVYPLYSFDDIETVFEGDHNQFDYEVFPNGFDQPATSNFYGIEGYADCGPGGDPDVGTCPNGTGSNPAFPDEWTPQDAADDLVFAADQYKYTQDFSTSTSLGANDAARRTAIVTALQSEINSNVDVRSENFEFNLLACPGYHETADELVSLATGSDVKSEAVVVADTPVDLNSSDTVAWAQTTARVTSTQAAYYYPWCVASNIDGTDVLASPVGTALRTYAFSDETTELWFAPAGTRRGLVQGVTDIGYVTGTLGGPTTFVPLYANQGQRDDLYRYFVNINPIVFFPGRGILVWGQKTVAADASALDRVNVSRLVAYIRRQLRKNTLSFVFEPNDQLTRDNLKAVVDAFLSDIVVKRGLFDFATVSDETNNTPDRIDRNELYIDVAIKPIKAAEFVYIPIRIVATGAEI